MQTAQKPAQTTSAPQRRSYQPPAVQDLGPWQAVTLVYTLPIGPGGMGGGITNTGGGSNGNW